MHLFTIVSWITYGLSALVVLGQIGIFVGLFALLWIRIRPTHSLSLKFQAIMPFVQRHALFGVFIVSLVATLGSLFYSEIAHFVPCVLCWYQRIAMYPIVLTSFVAYRRQDVGAGKYILPAAIIGLLAAIYHYVLQIVSLFAEIPEGLLPCSTVGMTASCTSSHFMTFGYITIPMMSLTAFGLICTLLCVRKLQQIIK